MLGHDMIVITGAGGHVGGLIARLLSERGERTRLLTRDPSRVPALQGAEVVRVDGFEDEDALDASLHEGDRVFMVAMHSSPEDRVRQHQAFVDAAVRAGVGRLVYLSCLNAGPDAVFLHGRSHGATEEMVGSCRHPMHVRPYEHVDGRHSDLVRRHRGDPRALRSRQDQLYLPAGDRSRARRDPDRGWARRAHL